MSNSAPNHFKMPRATMLESSEAPKKDAHAWDADIRLLNNRDMMATLAKVVALAVIIPGSLMSLIFATQGEWKTIPQVWLMLAAIGAGIGVMMLLIMLIFFRNRMKVRYTVSADGILFESIDRKVATANRVAVVAGILTGRPGPTGAGLMAMSQETQKVGWDGSFRAEFDDRARTIALRNRWRRLMIVQCLPENYEVVSAFVRDRMASHRTAARVARRSPLPRYLGWTAAVTVACLPLFALVDAFKVSMLLPILLLCFALATLWLIPLFGYVNLGCAALIAGSVILDAFSQHRSFFTPHDMYERWTVYSGDDWALLAVAGCSLAFLGWLSLRAVRGKFRSLLMSDMSDMGG
jgi:membrane protein YdbS with pleckstrin-like domain